MGKKARVDRTEVRNEVLRALRRSADKYGLDAAVKLVREEFPDVPRTTWYRWLNDFQAGPIDLAKDIARAASSNLPATPPPEYIVDKPAEARRNMDLLGRLESLYADAEMLRAYSITKDAEGKDKIRIPTFFMQSVKLRADLLESALKAMSQVWDLQRMQALHDLILTEIGKADPETQQRITAALKELDSRVGITMEARL